MNDIVIIGAGGFGREVQWLIERINESWKNKTGEIFWNILGYIDDGIAAGTDINGYKVLGNCDFLVERAIPLAVTCAVGTSKTRRKIIEKIRRNKNLSFPNLIDPSAKMSEHIALGIGNIICADNILTVNIRIADFCIVNLDCTVGHDARLSSFVTLYPSVNVSGNTYFGECVELGTGTQIIQGKSVGAGTIVGAGAVVIHDLPDECTAVGSPCKPIKYHNFSAIGGVLPSRCLDYPVCAAA
jgi:hypothetical protein